VNDVAPILATAVTQVKVVLVDDGTRIGCRFVVNDGTVGAGRRDGIEALAHEQRLLPVSKKWLEMVTGLCVRDERTNEGNVLAKLE